MATPARRPPLFSYKYRGGLLEKKKREKREDQERGKRREGRAKRGRRGRREERRQRRERKKQRRKQRREREGKRRVTVGHPTVSAASCRHQQLRHRRQPPQDSPQPLISFYCSSSCMQNVHSALSATRN